MMAMMAMMPRHTHISWHESHQHRAQFMSMGIVIVGFLCMVIAGPPLFDYWGA